MTNINFEADQREDLDSVNEAGSLAEQVVNYFINLSTLLPGPAPWATQRCPGCVIVNLPCVICPTLLFLSRLPISRQKKARNKSG